MQPKISTPTLLINSTIAKQNILRMIAKTNNQNITFRPHFKTHQSIEIGEWFRELGVTKITCSSVGMAEYFAEHGWQDITVAFPVNILEIDKINTLAKKISLGLLVESEQVISFLDDNCTSEVNIWLKIDAGYHRTGLDWQNKHRIFECANAVYNSKVLNFAGLLTHGGDSYHTPKAEIPALFAQGISRLNEVKSFLKENGINNCAISVGDTPGCSLSDSFAGTDEIRPGNFVYYDAQQFALGACSFEQISAVIACPVVALHPQRSEAVIYGGGIHLSKDMVTWNEKKYFGLVCLSDENGWVKLLPNAFVTATSQEHGIVSLPDETLKTLQEGDILYIIPAHSCMAANLLGSGLTTEGQYIHMYRYQSH
jgi:D-serine deaminase-like pyridoxal phosphate-dependent protein